MSCGSWIIEPGAHAFDEIYLSLAPSDMRKGFDGLSAQIRNILQLDPFSGAVFLFRGKFVWRRADKGALRLPAAQLAMRIEGLNWKHAIIHDEVVTPRDAKRGLQHLGPMFGNDATGFWQPVRGKAGGITSAQSRRAG